MSFRVLAIGILFLAAADGPCLAQSAPDEPDIPSIVDPTVDDIATIQPGSGAIGAPRTGDEGPTPFIAPVPFKHTQLGWGLAVLAGAIHRFDRDPTVKPSIGAIGGFYSENGSWGGTVMEMARLGGDAWRIRGLAAYANVRYDFYGIGEGAGEEGLSIGIEQDFLFANVSALYRVASRVYFGPQFLWMETTAAPRDSAGRENELIEGDFVETDLVAPGVQAELDTRDDDYWPTRGSLARVKAFFFIEELGGARSFQRYVAAWSWYGRLHGEQLVLATNANGAVSSGDAPFYALPAIGVARFGLRGYTQGRYRDKVMTTLQAELRYHARGRFGATAFGGFGQVAPSIEDIPDAKVLPAGGAGVRYRLTRQQPLHLRFDYAWGKDGGISYFGVTEAF